MGLGCGGGGGGFLPAAKRGTVEMAIIFPPRPAVGPAVLPVATNSVRITLSPPPVPPPARPWLIVRPPEGGNVGTTFDNVPAGPVLIVVEAFATSDGTGDVIAWAKTNVEVPVGGTASVTMITQALAVRVKVSPDPLNLEPSDVAPLTATAYDADGNILIGATFEWAGDNDAVAPVDENGKVTAHTDGDAHVTALETRSGKFGTALVQVRSRVANSVVVDPAERTLYPPSEPTAQMSATVYDALGVAIPYAPVAWSSTDETVATVDDNGRVTAQGDGSCQIKATSGAAEGVSYVNVYVAGQVNVIVR